MIEMALALASPPHRVTPIPYLEPSPVWEPFLLLNLLGQVSILIPPMEP